MTAPTASTDRMKLIIAVVAEAAGDRALRSLTGRGFHVTTVDRQAAVMGMRSVTLFIGVQGVYLDDALHAIRSACQGDPRSVNPVMPGAEPVDTWVSEPLPGGDEGATLLIFDVARYERIA